MGEPLYELIRRIFLKSECPVSQKDAFRIEDLTLILKHYEVHTLRELEKRCRIWKISPDSQNLGDKKDMETVKEFLIYLKTHGISNLVDLEKKLSNKE